MTSDKPERIALLDALRGLAILLMIAYHAGYDLVVFGFIPEYILYNPLLDWLEVLFAGLFIALAGISSRFSRNNLKRGLMVLVCALVVTAASLFPLPAPWLSLKAALGFGVSNAEIGAFVQEQGMTYDGSLGVAITALGDAPTAERVGKEVLRYLHPSAVLGSPVIIGILHLLSACMLIYGLLDKLSLRLRRSPEDVTVVVGIPLAGLFLALYAAKGFWPDIPSADYFPIAPWGLLFFVGVILGGPIKARQWPDWFYRVRVPFLPAVGRRTLLIYMVHQPILYGLLLLLGKIL